MIEIDSTINNNEDTLFCLDNFYNVNGHGIVLSGTLKRGVIKTGQKLFLGPHNNDFIEVLVKSIHNCIKEPRSMLNTYESGAICVRIINKKKDLFERSNFKKGQIITSNKEYVMKNLCIGFKAEILIFEHSTTIRNGYQTMLQCESIRQSVRLVTKDNNILESSKRYIVNIFFMQRPEFLEHGYRFMFREGKTKGQGKVIGLINYLPENITPKSKMFMENIKDLSFESPENTSDTKN
jgi:elongation factor 1-alpha